MAKKSAKKKPAAKSKPAKKPIKKAPAKPSKKPATKPKAKSVAKSKPAASSGFIAGPSPISTGSGPGPAQIGAEIVAAFNQGTGDEVAQKYWSPQVVSCEGVGVGMQWGGKEAVLAKNADWMSKHTLMGGAAEGPFVGSTGFAIKFNIHVKVNETGQEIHMNEVGVYTVQDGKIVREEFMYGN